MRTNHLSEGAATRSLVQIARDAADDAQRAALRSSLAEENYSPTLVAKSLRVGGGSAGVLRILGRLGMLEEYEGKRRALGLKPGPPPKGVKPR